MAPLAIALAADERFDSKLCVTGQHREMLDQVLDLFGLKPDFDLSVMKSGQQLADITATILQRMSDALDDFKPDVVIVHGDTATTFAASLAAYYRQIPVVHVEAGLRTGRIYSPWPEEGNRRLTAVLADLHFAPTEVAHSNLVREGIDPVKVHVTGNTVIDALLIAVARLDASPSVKLKLDAQFEKLDSYQRLILVTGHRRESFGEGFQQICQAIIEAAAEFPDVGVVYPVHLNPNVREPVTRLLANVNNIHLIEPLDYLPFVYLMRRSTLVLTDSGGIQEEAPSLGKPVLVMRETTERPEAIAAGTARLVGTRVETIMRSLRELLVNQDVYDRMSFAHNPYGDGLASQRIVSVLADRFGASE